MKRFSGLFALTTERGVTNRYMLLAGLYEFAIVLPLAVLVLHLGDRGFDLGAIGLAFAVRALLVVLLEVPTGGLADAIGRRPVALISQGFTLASMIALLLVTDTATLVVYALLQGIGAALSSGSIEAWYVDTLKGLNKDANLQKHFGQVSFVQSVCMLAGTFLGGVLPSLLGGADVPWPLDGFAISLFVGILLRVLMWVLTAALVVEPVGRFHGSVAGLRAVPEIVRDAARLCAHIPVVPYLLVAIVASGVAMGAVETFWQPVAQDAFGFTAETSGIVGVFALLTGVGTLIGSGWVMRYGDRVPGGSAAMATVLQLIKGLGLLTMGLLATRYGIGLGLVLVYLGIGGGLSPHDALLNDAVPDERRSVMLSVNSLAFFLGLALGFGALGLVADATTPHRALLIAGLVTAVASVAYWRAGRHSTTGAPAETTSSGA